MAEDAHLPAAGAARTPDSQLCVPGWSGQRDAYTCADWVCVSVSGSEPRKAAQNGPSARNSGIRYGGERSGRTKKARLRIFGTEFGREARTLFRGAGARTLTFPKTVRTVQDSALRGLRSLRSTVLNEGLETVSECAFEMSGVESVRVPASVRELRRSAFKLCESLRSVSLQEVLVSASMRDIGTQAFSGCKKLAVFRLARGSRLASVGCSALAGTHVKRNSVWLPPETRVSPDAFENSRRW